jgi:DNA ligase D-like protein (predicted ligase)/DNA ligase D-like protein (predicted 3'-phosphoesterase)
MSHFYKPMLAQAADASFDSKEWIFEVKWDGIRAISRVDAELRIRSRNDKDLSQYFPELNELKNLTHCVVLDGEIVVMRQGKPDFQAVLERRKASSSAEIRQLSQSSPATYIVFDILERHGKPLIDLTLSERKRLLEQSVADGKHVTLSSYVEKNGKDYYQAVLGKGLEGVIAKKKVSVYEPGIRSNSWLKIKKLLTCDCVVLGYTEGEGNRKNTFGALILGLYQKGKLVFVGKVGTGFSQNDLETLIQTFHALETPQMPPEANASETTRWLKPELVCEVAYQALTRENRLRMPRFKGLRFDKKPEDCSFDQLIPLALHPYVSRRNFAVTTEPKPLSQSSSVKRLAFVVQEHHARKLHYDLRLEREGVLKSWAVPKGVPEKNGEKRLAVETEDHPLEYQSFKGEIPKGQYGAGTVNIWDKGTYEAKIWQDDRKEFSLNGERLRGKYLLTRFKKAGEKYWIFLKMRDEDG